MLWKDRNLLIFEGKTDLGHNLDYKISTQAYLISQDASKPFPTYSVRPRQELHIACLPPPANSFKLNIDGSHCSWTKSSACGGLIRDSRGAFIKGFHCHLGTSTAIAVELWGLPYGLKLAKQLHLPYLLVEVDSQVVSKLVSNGFCTNQALQPLLHEALHLLRASDWDVSMSHIYREANCCVDFLANLGYHGDFNWTIGDSPHDKLSLKLRFDVMGCSTPCFVR